MNKLTFVLLLGLSIQSFAQMNAISNHQAGLLDKAKMEIDKATADAKQTTKAKTWYTRGKIYESIANDNTGLYSKLDSNAAFEAYNSYKKASELDKPGGSYDKDAKAALASPSLYSALMNQASKRYKLNNYSEAIKAFQLASETNPKDTTAILYAGYASQQGKEYDNAANFYEKYIALGGKDPEVYYYLSSIYKSKENYDKALDAVKKGLAISPNSKTLRDEELNLYLVSGKSEQAIENLRKAVEKEPNNPQYQLNLGIMLDNAGKKEEALASYNKVLQLDPTNYDANYNLGVFYFNQAVEINKKLSNMDLKQYQKDGKKVEGEVQAKFQQALPFFEKAYQVKPDDASLMENLRKVYSQLKRTADVERMNKAIDASESKNKK